MLTHNPTDEEKMKADESESSYSRTDIEDMKKLAQLLHNVVG